MFSGSTFLYFLSHLTVVLSLLQFYAVNKDKSIELLTLIQNHLKHVVEKLKYIPTEEVMNLSRLFTTIHVLGIINLTVYTFFQESAILITILTLTIFSSNDLFVQLAHWYIFVSGLLSHFNAFLFSFEFS